MTTSQLHALADSASDQSAQSTLKDNADTDDTTNITVDDPKTLFPDPTDTPKITASDDDTADRVGLVRNYLRLESLYAPLQATRQLVAWKAENRSHQLVTKETDAPAILTLIAVISTDSFFLTPDAYYKGGNDVTPSLADVKLTCVARRPVDTDIANDFTSALANVLWLMDQIRTTGVPRIGVTLPTGSVTPISFKFRHVLFKVSFPFLPFPSY